MKRPYNYHSTKEDKDLFEAMAEVKAYACNSMPLPENYHYEHLTIISYKLIRQWLKHNGIDDKTLSCLTFPNDSGKEPSIKPDGGLIVAVKKDESGNILDLVPLLSSEAKHQDSTVGNAIERLFKNYNAISNLFLKNKVFPYLCFGQGDAFTSEFINNKIRVAALCNVNEEVNVLFDSENAKHGSFHLRKDKWEIPEMYGRLVTAMKQSYSYFFGKNNSKMEEEFCEAVTH